MHNLPQADAWGGLFFTLAGLSFSFRDSLHKRIYERVDQSFFWRARATRVVPATDIASKRRRPHRFDAASLLGTQLSHSRRSDAGRIASTRHRCRVILMAGTHLGLSHGLTRAGWCRWLTAEHTMYSESELARSVIIGGTYV